MKSAEGAAVGVEVVVSREAFEEIPAAATDLRRKRRADDAARLVERARHLEARERALVEAVYADGRSAREVSRLSGIATRSLRRRLRRIVLRVSTPEFLFVVRHMESWRTQRRMVAEACVVRGWSMRASAASLGMTFHSVRRHMDAIISLYELACAPARWQLCWSLGGPVDAEKGS